MNNPRLRWTVLLVALGAAVIASFYPVEQPAAAAPARPRTPETAILAVPPVIAQPDTERANVDPFAARGWQAKPSVEEAVASVPQAPAPVGVELSIAPVAPALPFQFVGRMNDGGNEVVYLREGESIVLARRGETLQGIYQVLELGAGEIEFLHVPTGQKQSMSLPAPDS